MKSLALWGSGGHGKVVLDLARASGAFERLFFIDDNCAMHGVQVANCEVRGPEALGPANSGAFLVCIGDNRTRANRFEALRRCGLEPATLVHPTAVVSPSACIGAGTVVMPRAVINADARIGENCIVNTGAIIEHDCRLGNHVHISPGASLGGGAQLDDYVHAGLNAAVLPGITVGQSSVIGAGAVVIRPVGSGVVVAGVPASVLKHVLSEA